MSKIRAILEKDNVKCIILLFIASLFICMPLISKKIDITYDDLINIGIPQNKINAAYIILENLILKKKIKNDKSHLVHYVLKNKKVWCTCKI